MDERKENRMGTMPVNKLLISMSLPMMASMLMQALYNVVDSIFVARISEQALTAVSLAFPVQAMMIAVSVGTGVGVNSLLSRKLGEHHYTDANLVAVNGLFLAFVSAAVFMLFGFLGVGTFFRAFTDSPELISMGSNYTFICTVFSFGVFTSIIGERIIQATGNTFYSMVSQMAGAITNIILDPILIFGLLGFPRLEVTGAAIATVLGQMVSMVLNFYFNFTKNHEVTLSFKGFRPHARIIGEIYRIGLPSIIMQSLGSIMTLGMNAILILFSETAVTLFGIYFKLQSFIFMPVFGLTNGMIPIVAFNYGAKKHARILSAIKLSLVLAVGIMVAGMLLFLFFPQWMLTALFHASGEMLAIGVPAFRIICLHFPLAAIGIVLSCSFQALGNGVYSLVISFCRQIGVILPAAYLLGRFVGLDMLWFAFPIAEFLALLLALALFLYMYRTKLKSF